MDIATKSQCSHSWCHSGEGESPIFLQTILDSTDALTDNLANSLLENQVHVWCAWLDDFTDYREILTSVLSSDEKTRASRIFRPIDRDRFVLRHGLLRYILGDCTGCQPSQIRLEYEGRGKPFLAPLPSGRSLHFSLSHSNGVAVYAVAQCAQVGIDVEQVMDLPEWLDIVEEHFSKREQTVFHDIPEAQRLEAFYRGWTRKEAFLKATGQGISDGLCQIEVNIEPDELAEILSIEDNAASAAEWTLSDLPTYPGFVGALAIRTYRAAVHNRICHAR